MTPFLRPFFIWNKFLCSLVCLLFCVQVGVKRRELQTLFEVVSKLPEVTLKGHDQSIVAFYHGTLTYNFGANISNTRISPSVSRTKFEFCLSHLLTCDSRTSATSD